MKKLVCLLLCCHFFISFYAQSVVCRKPSIYGFDNEYSTGKAYCGNYTNSMKQMKMYITVQDQNIYVHSNFISEGYAYPTKFATSEPLSNMDDIAMNLIYSEYPDEASLAEMRNYLRNNMELILDPEVLSHPQYGSLNYSTVKNLKIACPDNSARPAMIIYDRLGNIEYLVKINNQIAVRLKGQNLDYIISGLESKEINFQNLGLISLVENSATQNLIRQKFSDIHIPFNYSSVADFKNILLKNRNKRIALLGHIENGRFLTLDQANNEIFAIELDELIRFQEENNLEIILLGCNSAIESGSPGAINKFNSLDALNRLDKARDTKNVGEFLDSLGLNTLQFVVDETFFKDGVAAMDGSQPSRMDITIYDKRKVSIGKISGPASGSIIFLGLGNLIDPPIPVVASITDSIVPDNAINGIVPDPPGSSNKNIAFIIVGTLGFALLGLIVYKKINN